MNKNDIKMGIDYLCDMVADNEFDQHRQKKQANKVIDVCDEFLNSSFPSPVKKKQTDSDK